MQILINICTSLYMNKYKCVCKNTYINTYEHLQYVFVLICFKYVQNMYMENDWWCF